MYPPDHTNEFFHHLNVAVKLIDDSAKLQINQLWLVAVDNCQTTLEKSDLPVNITLVLLPQTVLQLNTLLLANEIIVADNADNNNPDNVTPLVHRLWPESLLAANDRPYHNLGDIVLALSSTPIKADVAVAKTIVVTELNSAASLYHTLLNPAPKLLPKCVQHLASSLQYVPQLAAF